MTDNDDEGETMKDDEKQIQIYRYKCRCGGQFMNPTYKIKKFHDGIYSPKGIRLPCCPFCGKVLEGLIK